MDQNIEIISAKWFILNILKIILDTICIISTHCIGRSAGTIKFCLIHGSTDWSTLEHGLFRNCSCFVYQWGATSPRNPALIYRTKTISFAADCVGVVPTVVDFEVMNRVGITRICSCTRIKYVITTTFILFQRFSIYFDSTIITANQMHDSKTTLSPQQAF